jgi:VWFA-related protein
MAVQAAATRQFMLLIDSRFSPRKGLFFANKVAAAYLRDSLAPGDLVAAATMGPAGLKVLTNFTRDHAYVADVIAGTSTVAMPGSDPLGFSSSDRSGGSGSLWSDPQGMGDGIRAAGGVGNRRDEEFEDADALLAQADTRDTQNHALDFLGDLETLVQRLAPFRGRKQIVLFSGGFADELWLALGGDSEVFSKMQKVFQEARRADVVVHSVDLNGITEAIDLVSQAGPNGDLNEKGPVGIPHSGTKDSPGRGTLIALSINTGGRAIPPTGDFKRALGEVDQISRHSYVMAFEASPTEGPSERPRRLKVRVHRAGLSVSYRPEYKVAAPGPASTLSIQGQAREAIAKGLSGGPLRLRLVTLPYRDLLGKPSINTVLQIGGEALAEAAQGKEMAVQIYGYAMASGRVLDGIAFSTSIDLLKFGSAVRASGLNVVAAFPALAGNVDLRFFVRAGTSDVTGSIQRNVAVPAFAGDGNVVSEPMFPLSSVDRLAIPFEPQGRPPIKLPFFVGEKAFVPDAFVILKPGHSRDACVFVWRHPDRRTAAFQISAELVQSGRAPVPVGIEGAPQVVPDADGFDRYLLTLSPPAAAKGDYTLRLTFVEVGTGRTSRSEASVVIEE